MKKHKKTITGIFAATAMLTIILDGKTAISSAVDGMDLCIRSVIPALLPFFFLSGLLNGSLFGREIRPLQWLERFCRIPSGGISIFLIGVLSGYPVGAQLVSDTYHAGGLNKESANRMLGFCSNAGPAFIFGILSPLFSNKLIPWILWFIHIFAAIVTGRILPANEIACCCIKKPYTLTVYQSLQNALRTAATVCGWVLLFRILIGFFERWFFWLLPTEIRVIISGMLELTNGCALLTLIHKEGTRFVLVSLLLSFGGLCVIMQTKSVTKTLRLSFYFPGKLFQSVISVLFSILLQPIIFDKEDIFYVSSLTVLVILFIAVTGYVLTRKKVVDFIKSLLYNSNRNEDLKGEAVCCFAKK